ncbi:glycoside hydrolase family 127 protein [bacterium]|nr:glycoside hydrolase family 127 protein [bacterium]
MQTGLIVVMLTIMWTSGSAAAGGERDSLSPARTEQLQLSGLLGQRLAANRDQRLLTFPSDEMLLSGFQHRPGSQEWIGEHVGKWLHAADLGLEACPDDEALRGRLDRLASALMETQQPDGYLGTYLDQDRWTSWDVWVHKYVLLGLLEYHAATGDAGALSACKRIGDLLVETFGPGRRDIIAAGTHQGLAATSILEAMCLLYRRTGDARYLSFCRYLIERVDERNGLLSIPENTGMIHGVGNGKAYETMSNYVGLVEYWRCTGDARALRVAQLAQADLASHYRFLTGSIDGHEHFAVPDTLVPSGRCAETCVQVTWEQLNLQLLRATGEPRYADELHRHVYNHLLAAQHPDGLLWCYFTPLEGRKPYAREMNCCGSSGIRGIELMRQFAVMEGSDALVVNLYENCEYRTRMSGVPVTLTMATQYPWDGTVAVTVKAERPATFTLKLLIPFFAERAALDGKRIRVKPGAYAELSREWRGSATLSLRFEMPVVAHEQGGRTALSRGPVFFACDAADNHGVDLGAARPDVKRLRECEFNAQAHTLAVPAVGGGRLIYRPYCEAGTGGSLMSVWMPVCGGILARPEVSRAFTPPYEQWTSRAGRARGSLVDGEPRVYCNTDDGAPPRRTGSPSTSPVPRASRAWSFITATSLPAGAGGRRTACRSSWRRERAPADPGGSSACWIIPRPRRRNGVPCNRSVATSCASRP